MTSGGTGSNPRQTQWNMRCTFEQGNFLSSSNFPLPVINPLLFLTHSHSSTMDADIHAYTEAGKPRKRASIDGGNKNLLLSKTFTVVLGLT